MQKDEIYVDFDGNIVKYLPKDFNKLKHAYMISIHKSQGSEFDRVTVVEETFPFDRTEHARWLYTACTRAAQKLVLVRP